MPLIQHLLDNNDPKWVDNERELRREWARLYDEIQVDHSCMKGESCVKVYGVPGNDLGLLYFEDPADGTLMMRTIVNVRTKKYVREYPYTDSTKGMNDGAFREWLEANGWASSNRMAHSGCRIHKIECSEGRYVMPYIDGCGSVEDHGSYFTIDGNISASSTDGYINCGVTCPCCGGAFSDEDALTYVDCRGESICESCLEDNYRYAYGRRYEDWYPEEDCIQCETDGNWYLETSASDHDVYECEVTGNWYHLDDLVNTKDGFVYVDRAQALDHEDSDGNTHAVESDAKQLPDGTWCHADDYDDLLAEQQVEDEDETVTEGEQA